MAPFEDQSLSVPNDIAKHLAHVPAQLVSRQVDKIRDPDLWEELVACANLALVEVSHRVDFSQSVVTILAFVNRRVSGAIIDAKRSRKRHIYGVPRRQKNGKFHSGRLRNSEELLAGYRKEIATSHSNLSSNRDAYITVLSQLGYSREFAIVVGRSWGLRLIDLAEVYGVSESRICRISKDTRAVFANDECTMSTHIDGRKIRFIEGSIPNVVDVSSATSPDELLFLLHLKMLLVADAFEPKDIGMLVRFCFEHATAVQISESNAMYYGTVKKAIYRILGQVRSVYEEGNISLLGANQKRQRADVYGRLSSVWKKSIDSGDMRRKMFEEYEAVLTPKQREVLQLYLIQNLSIVEITKKLCRDDIASVYRIFERGVVGLERAIGQGRKTFMHHNSSQ